MSTRKGNDLPERRGRVVRSTTVSFAGLEATARRAQAKGAYFDRGRHRQEKKITRWLDGLEEYEFAYGLISHAQLLVAPPRPDCADSDCEDAACEEDGNPTLAGPDEIREASHALVAGLPTSFREAVRKDAEALAGVCRRLSPDTPWLTMRLEICQHNACWRWHQDFYIGRAIICYVGPGTCTADDKAVQWDQFEKTKDDELNDSCVPSKGVKQMQNNAVLLMKGDSWPGIRGKGLTHKSPGVPGDAPTKRLLLKVDLNNFRPPLDSEEEDFTDDEEDEDEGEGLAGADKSGGRSAALKRLATSAGFKSAKAWKARRRF